MMFLSARERPSCSSPTTWWKRAALPTASVSCTRAASYNKDRLPKSSKGRATTSSANSSIRRSLRHEKSVPPQSHRGGSGALDRGVDPASAAFRPAAGGLEEIHRVGHSRRNDAALDGRGRPHRGALSRVRRNPD